MPVTPDALRHAMSRFATGVTVIVSQLDGTVYGMTANAVTSVSLEPPLILVCVGRERTMHGVLERTRGFTVNVLSEEQEILSRYFAGARHLLAEDALPFDGSQGTAHPVLEGVLAWMECTVTATYPGGDHTIFLAQVERASWRDGRPLVFFGSRYTRLAP